MNFIIDKDNIKDWGSFWFDFKGKEYYGFQKQIRELKKMDKINCRITKIKRIQDGIHSRR